MSIEETLNICEKNLESVFKAKVSLLINFASEELKAEIRFENGVKMDLLYPIFRKEFKPLYLTNLIYDEILRQYCKDLLRNN